MRETSCGFDSRPRHHYGSLAQLAEQQTGQVPLKGQHLICVVVGSRPTETSFFLQYAGMAEQADAPGLGSGGGNSMQVRFLLPAPYDAVPKSGLRGQTANLLSRRFESGPRLQVHLRKGEKSV